MKLRTLRNNVNLAGKTVLLRIDANVPIKNGRAVDGKHGKIARASVDIQWLSQRGARVVVMTHVNRPGGKRVSAYSVKPAARRLSNLLGERVKVSHQIIGEKAERLVGKMKDGDVLMLENLRFDPRERENSPAFAAALARMGDLYVNDAFAVSHRAHASVDAITSELPSYAGPAFAREVSVLSKLVRAPRQPFVVAMGGLKLETKLPTMRELLKDVDHMLVGGALANAFLAAQGHGIGRSVCDEGGPELASKVLARWKGKLELPEDVVVASSLRKNARSRVTTVDDVREKEYIVDIGPKSMERYTALLAKAKTIAWNGPFGYCEQKRFCGATSELARTIASRTGKATTVIGGGDTEPYVERLGIYDKFSLVSTGGGAMLAFLAGEPLPGVEALKL